ncbi:MAG TPA: nicotinamide mononucleotide transporter [Flavobacteriaceae bacterium]|nr:nicotinamide mononucleotide transporter [Flavobacteriaceae bacterium]
MNPIFDFLVEPYQNYNTLDIVLEAVAVLLGLLSVWFAQRDHIAVYPSGMLSTGIFVYILFQANLLGDMLINAYFFVMSIYGWYFWIQKEGNQVLNPIAKMNSKEFKWAIVLFFGAVLFVIGIYLFFDKWTDWTAPVDTFTTALFFVGMWLMARRKIEHWIFWIVGDVISVPLYLYKGLGLTSIQYLIFTLIAILGYIQWKKTYSKELQTA